MWLFTSSFLKGVLFVKNKICTIFTNGNNTKVGQLIMTLHLAFDLPIRLVTHEERF